MTLRGDELVVRIAYSERLSRLLGEIRGARYMHIEQEWLVPIAAHDALRAIIPEINRLGRPPKPRPAPPTPAPQPAHQRDRPVRAPLRREYLEKSPAPAIPLTLESIGAYTSNPRAPRQRPRDDVSQVLGYDDAGREVLKPVRRRTDYSTANSVGSRGVTNTYLLAMGPIYRIAEPQSWRNTRIYYARISPDGMQEMTAEEVAACAER